MAPAFYLRTEKEVFQILEHFCANPEVVKLVSCSTQLTMKFTMLINVIVGILTFISMINTSSESLKQVKSIVYFSVF